MIKYSGWPTGLAYSVQRVAYRRGL